MAATKIFIYGKHAVAEALRHRPDLVRKIHIDKGMDDRELRSLIQKSRIPTEPLDKRRVTSMVEGNAPHQGIVALLSLGEFMVPAEHYVEDVALSRETTLVYLDGITDPHNVGAIIRSAVALGASAVLLPTYKQSPVTPAVIKASAGMAFQVPLVSVTNAQQTLAQLKKKGVRIYGLAADGTRSLPEATFGGPVLLVLGNEGQGLSASTKALCDETLSIPITDTAESLNVAASAAIVLYARRIA